MNDLDRKNAPQEHRVRQRVLNAAVEILEREGLSDQLLDRAAAVADCPIENAKTFFRSAEDIVLALYARFAADLEERVLEFPAGCVADRFAAMMQAKFGIVAPYREPLAALTASLLDPRSEIGAVNPQTEVIRARVQGTIDAVIAGATDRPDANAAALTNILYGVHLGLMLLWCQDRSPDSVAARRAIDLVRDMLQMLGPYLASTAATQALSRVDAVFRPIFEPEADLEYAERAVAILTCLFRHRRLEGDASECETQPCPQCFALHLPRLKYFLRANLPIEFVLPAFPAKSPSRRKTLGPLPDKAEELALAHLETIGDDIEKLHAPGVRMTICSDGHVFSDLVGVDDRHVSEYGAEIARLITEMKLRHLETFQLSGLYELDDFEATRNLLVRHFAKPVAEIESRVENFAHARSLFNGIHRFLTEEQADVQPDRSRTQVRKACRGKAYEVIQRSDAWGRLLSECFPMALRLSIHPQHPHAEKIGIMLGPATNVWLTPWHGAALKTEGGWLLTRRHEAEERGAHVVVRDDRPYYLALDADHREPAGLK